jgi:WbqC-like protein family
LQNSDSYCLKIEKLILATSYLPPIWYIEKLISAEDVIIESHEHFVKQSIRNRCHILSPNGVQSLIVPVMHQNRNHSAIKDIRIASDMPWQRQHWRSLCAAYQRSAFFEFYQDDLVRFYEKPYDFLLDYNTELLHFLLEQLQIKKTIGVTAAYEAPVPDNPEDLRAVCDTGLPLVSGTEISYPQVFGYKEGFVPGLSAVDLLFSMGPAACRYMKMRE